MQYPLLTSRDYVNTMKDAARFLSTKDIVSIKIRFLRREGGDNYSQAYSTGQAYSAIDAQMRLFFKDQTTVNYSRAYLGRVGLDAFVYVEHETGPEFVVATSALAIPETLDQFVDDLVKGIVTLFGASSEKFNAFGIEERTIETQNLLKVFDFPSMNLEEIWKDLKAAILARREASSEVERMASEIGESIEYGGGLADQYLEYVFEDRPLAEVGSYTGEQRISVVDLNDNLETLRQQLKWVRQFDDRGLPSMEVGDAIVPIDIVQHLEDRDKFSLEWLSYPEYFDHPGFSLRYFLRNNKYLGADFQRRKPESLRSDMKKPLQQFIAWRHAVSFNATIYDRVKGFFTGGGAPPVVGAAPVVYLSVSLTTVNQGLGISASPAYFVTWNKFGSLTSPSNGSLLPGTYIFGGSGPGVPRFKFDKHPASIPPQFKVVTTKF